ncbi:MAG: hypothetical protein ACE5HY_05135, partial [Candidatus Hydrothermarchaeales archaeon]
MPKSKKELARTTLKQRLAKYKCIPPDKKQEVSDLPRWSKTAFAFMEFNGYTYAEAAKKLNKAKSTLESYAASPAARKWRGLLRETADDPLSLARAILGSTAVGIAV